MQSSKSRTTEVAPVAAAADPIGWLKVSQPENPGGEWRIMNAAGEVMAALGRPDVAERLVCVHNAALFREEAGG